MNLRSITKHCLRAVLALAFGLSGASKAQEWIPEGFEDLSAPQQTVVDVFYGGVYLASPQAKFNADTITILDPDLIVTRMNDLLDPKEFKTLLEFPLNTNASLICRSKFSTDCGQLSTKSVGVIFTVAQLRVDLFVGPDLLSLVTLEQLKFVPPSDAGFSMFDDLSVYASGSSDTDLTYNMSNNTMFAYAENRLQINSNVTSGGDVAIDTLAFKRERNGFDYQAGIFRENAGSFQFMQNQQFLGATFGSSLVTRKDLDLALGTTFTIFLESRSLVQIYKDNRLLGSNYYETGNQQIDTSTLPPGAYDVELRIIDSSGRTRTERRFYSKNGKIPPEGESLFFVQAGQYVETLEDKILPETINDGFLRAGIERRLTASSAAKIGFSTNNQSTMLEAGLFHQGLKYEISAGFGYDDYNRSAFNVQYQYRYSRGAVGLSAREISGGNIPVDEISQLGEDTTQLGLNGSIGTDFGDIDLFVDYTEGEGTNGSESFGIKWRPRSFFGLPDMTSSVELSENDGSTLFLVRLNYNSSRGAWSNRGSVQYSGLKKEDESYSNSITGSASSTWEKEDPAGNNYSVDVRADHQENDSVEAGLQAETARGMASFTTKHNIDNNTWEYSGSLRTSFAATTDSIGFGGKSGGASGFLVNVQGPADSDSQVEVKVGRQTIGSIPANTSVFIPAGPYRTHTLEFLSAGNSIENIEYRARPYTLYPGNVIAVRPKIKEIVIAVGKIYLSSGKPLQDALIQGVEGLAITNAYGFFQAEMTPDVRELTFIKGDTSCLVRLPAYELNRGVARLGKLICNSSQTQ